MVAQSIITAAAETLPLVMPFSTATRESGEGKDGGQVMAQLALTHTVLEHRLYQALLSEVSAAQTRVCMFSLRQLMTLTQFPNYTAVRRGLRGLISKLSIEQHRIAGAGLSPQTIAFLVFTPREIFARRAATQFTQSPSVLENAPESKSFGQAIERLAGRYDLSRREAQVALCCVQGMTNAQIAEQLYIGEQTVKFHLRHIFVKYGVKRRAELIARLLGTD